MSGTPAPADISPESFKRVTEQNEALKAQLAEAQSNYDQAAKAAKGAIARAKYLEHRASTDETLKPIVVELEMATSMLDGTETDQLEATVQAVAEKIATFRGVTPAAAPPTDPPTPPPAAPNTQVPGQVVPQPNPGADGAPAKPEVLDIQGRSDLVAKEGMDGAREALASGAIKLDPAVRERHGL